ncbi:GAF domain-containing protein [Kangiella sp. TOML190]|uniref:GAF domain-containing protein n=1 Tax=Kangiella sp. TOML190 TaxID=2931351 RepID=UPI00203C869D|nr:GAF domain-containing protein [Kangiella sp. TOML190]
MGLASYHIEKYEDEANRLGMLGGLGILDSSPEPFYDKITRSVAQKFNASISLVSIVDKDRLFFKSSFGSDVEQVPRANTFCTVAILSDDVLVVEDAKDDERFINCPIVKSDPYARFYAGAPLILTSGVIIGTLCFVYDEPYYNFSKEDARYLKDMADIVTSYIELRISKEHKDPINLLPLASIATSTINHFAQIRKESVSAFSIELFGSARVSELVISFGEKKFFSILQQGVRAIEKVLPHHKSHVFFLVWIGFCVWLLDSINKKQ